MAEEATPVSTDTPTAKGAICSSIEKNERRSGDCVFDKNINENHNHDCKSSFIGNQDTTTTSIAKRVCHRSHSSVTLRRTVCCVVVRET